MCLARVNARALVLSAFVLVCEDDKEKYGEETSKGGNVYPSEMEFPRTARLWHRGVASDDEDDGNDDDDDAIDDDDDDVSDFLINDDDDDVRGR